MKKLLILTAAILLFISGCKKNDGEHDSPFYLNVTVENGSQHISKIDMVYAKAVGVLESTPETIAKTSYGNGTFTLELPGTIGEKYLFPIENTIFPGINNINISDKTAKITAVVLYAEKDGENVGNIYRSSFDQTIIFQWPNDEILEKIKEIYATGAYGTSYIYVNKSVTITGTTVINEIQGHAIDNPYTCNYNLHLTKGWNIYATKTTGTWENNTLKTGTVEITNVEPAGMKWFYLTIYGLGIPVV